MLDFVSASFAMPVKETPASNQRLPSKQPDDCCLVGPPKSTPRRPGQGETKDPATALFHKGGLPVVAMGGDELTLEVTCGQNQAALYMSRLQLGSKGTCVLFENSWLTPNEFQYISGRETAKDWKRSIKHHGKSLKVLISKGILATSPLRCNCGQCGQSKEKDVFKYIVTEDAKMTSASTLRDVFTTDPSKLVKPERTKDVLDRKLCGASGEPNENKKNVTIETPTNALQRPSVEQCLTSYSQGGARLASLCDKSVYTGTTKDCCFRSNVDDAYRVEQSCHLANKANNKMSGEDTDSKLKTKKRTDGNDNEEPSKDGSRLVHDGDQRKLGTESVKTSMAESPATGGTSQKRSASSGNKPSSGDWSQGIANYSTHQSESTVSKSSPHDKTRKSTPSSHLMPSSNADKPLCIQANASCSSKTSLPNTSISASNPARPSPSESSFVFPSFGSPYYPMIPTPQLPAYYTNPYMWSMPFAANPSTCSYGWTAPSEIAAAGCLLSPTKESLECSMVNADRAFNFPWMKRLNSSAADRETTNETGSSGKRKLDCDAAAEYLLPSKHRLYLADSLRSAYGDAVGWPGYSPNAAAAIDFRFLPYNLPSYIPDVRPAHGLFAGNFGKGCENPSSGLGLFPGLFPSQCLGVNSR